MSTFLSHYTTFTKEVILILIVVLLAVNFYLIPSYIAEFRRHPQTKTILVLNILLGWTIIGWGVALFASIEQIDPLNPEPRNHRRSTPRQRER